MRRLFEKFFACVSFQQGSALLFTTFSVSMPEATAMLFRLDVSCRVSGMDTNSSRCCNHLSSFCGYSVFAFLSVWSDYTLDFCHVLSLQV